MNKKKITIVLSALVFLFAVFCFLAFKTDSIIQTPALEDLVLVQHMPDGKFPLFYDKDFATDEKNYRAMADFRTFDLGAMPLGEFGSMEYRVVNEKNEGPWQEFPGKDLYYNTGESGALVLVGGKNVVEVKISRWIFKKSIYRIAVLCK